MLALLACETEQRPLLPGERPNIVLLVSAIRPSDGIPIHSAVQSVSVDLPSLLSSQWAPGPGANTLSGVLSLYGYTVASPWSIATPEPFLYVATQDVPSEIRSDLRNAGLADRTALIVVSADWPGPGALGWEGPGRPAPLGDKETVSTLDVMPTLLALAGATVPTDAGGVNLAAERSRVAFSIATDGSFAAQSSRHRLTTSQRDPLAADPPPDAIVEPDDAEARAALWGALVAWRKQQTATSAPDRLGADRFDRLSTEQGYWK